MLDVTLLKAMPITQAMLEANRVETLDEADSYISKLINIPIDREEAKDVFEKILGYNPVTYYDRKDITSLVDSKLENAKYSHLEDEKDDIIEDAMDIYDTNRRIHQDSAVNAAFDMRMDIDDIKKQLADDFDDEDFDYDDLVEED